MQILSPDCVSEDLSRMALTANTSSQHQSMMISGVQSVAMRYVEVADEICVFCPAELLATVLDAMLRPVLEAYQPVLVTACGRAHVVSAAASAEGKGNPRLRLGVGVLDACIAEGTSVFMARIADPQHAAAFLAAVFDSPTE